MRQGPPLKEAFEFTCKHFLKIEATHRTVARSLIRIRMDDPPILNWQVDSLELSDVDTHREGPMMRVAVKVREVHARVENALSSVNSVLKADQGTFGIEENATTQ